MRRLERLASALDVSLRPSSLKRASDACLKPLELQCHALERCQGSNLYGMQGLHHSRVRQVWRGPIGLERQAATEVCQVKGCQFTKANGELNRFFDSWNVQKKPRAPYVLLKISLLNRKSVRDLQNLGDFFSPLILKT
jgi:hypothetical protein